MSRTPLLTLAAALAVAVPASAQESPHLTLSAQRLRRLDQFLDREVKANHMSGVVALILQDGKVAYQHAVGWADREAGRTMTPDAIFRIASQTKAITSAALLTLVEEGKVDVDDPVSRYLPSFAKTTVAQPSPNGPVTVPAKRAITVKDLLTHTSGISYGVDSLVAPLYAAKGLGPAAGWGWYTADKNEPICTTIDRLATLPFVAQPGEAFVYGYNTDVLGCLIERVSGMPLDRFIADRITRPLGMPDTHFFLPPEKRARLAAVYSPGQDSTVTRAPDGPRGQGDYVDGPRMSFAGGAGLLSTARDYARFLQMILNGGELDGVRILSPRTVALMTHDQLGSVSLGPGTGFGFGFSTVEQVGASGLAPAGTFGWGGAYATVYQVDPTDRLVIVFMTQLLPNGPAKIRDRFPALVYQALVPAGRPSR
jgi:CubicO group peptidase (beta-lactamase class C family)